MVKRLLKNDAEVQDTLQDVMLKLWNKRDQIFQHEKPDAYVLTVCRNHCLDQLKKKRDFLMDDQNEHRVINLPERGTNLDAREQLDIVQQIIEQLPDKYREVIQYREIDGLDFEEIKLLTGYEVAHLRVLLSRARLKIKEEIRKIYDYETRGNQQTAGKIL